MNDQTIIDKIDRPGFAWENLNEAEQCNLLGSIRELLAERATQPAQRQSQIDIHLITCQEARKIGGGLIDKIPADDVTALGRAIYQRILDSQPAQKRCCEHDSDCAIHNAPAYPVGPCDCTLSEKPAQEQVAAIRAVPETTVRKAPPGWDYEKQGGYLIGYGDCTCVLSHYCDGKCRPIFEYCLPDKATAPAPDHETIVREDGGLICTACGTTAPQPQPSDNSCDSDWFWNLVIAYAKGVGSEGKALVSQVDAWNVAACAEVETKRQVLSSAYRSATARAEAAEAKLASTRLTDAQIIQRAGEIFGFKPHEMGELAKSQYLDFARWAAGEE